MTSPLPPPRTGDFDTSNSNAIRRFNRTYGLIPPAVESQETQMKRVLQQLSFKDSDIGRYRYLSSLRSSHIDLFFRLFVEHITEIAPLWYTPTVGTACLLWSTDYVAHDGLYLGYQDKGRIASVLDNWPEKHVEITVISDGSRILGLGDLGINGMGIPIGKLSLYTACAGIRPDRTLPIMLDLGCGTQSIREDPLYMGSRSPRRSEAEELEFMDEVMAALNEKFPGILVQFEDFKNPFPALEKYGPRYTCFNDDIQGTGAVVLAGIISAVRQSGIHPRDHRSVFLGAGSAGVGVAKVIVEYFMNEGLTEDEARRCFWLVDTKGLVTNDRGDKLAAHKVYFSRDDNKGQQYKTLDQVIDYVKPTILMGLSTIGGAFTPEMLTKMGKWNDRPIIFPLSNPSSKSECTFEDAIKYTEGRCLFASGSPFQPIEFKGKTFVPGQGNNMYSFPGLGLGAILSKATLVTTSMVYASAIALSKSLLPEEVAKGYLYPDLRRIRQVSVLVTLGVVRAAQEAKVARETHIDTMDDEALKAWIVSRAYDPHLEKGIVEDNLRAIVADLPPKSELPKPRASSHGQSHL